MDFYIIFEDSINKKTTKKLIDIIRKIETEIEKFQRIIIFFSSSGGTIDLGFLLATVIQNSKIPIVMHAMNHIDSIANVVYLSAKERTAESYAKFYFHGATTEGSFDIKGLNEEISSIKTGNRRIAHYISENSNLPLKGVEGIMEAGTTISAINALNYGIVQTITPKKIPADAPREEIIFIE